MKKTLFTTLIATLLLSGCQTPYQSRTTQTRQTQDQLIAQEQQRRMAGRLETLEMEIGRISRELDGLRRNLDTRCAAIELKSEEDKRELITRLTAQLEKLLVKAAPPAAAPVSGGTAYGIEHVVQPGETLSTIATAYGASVKKLIEVNLIKDANRLSVGQKLFIPE
ncbi:MAG: LysM peptidoglycan-binding domain-containing protein [Verrucomicrobia bacterium]|nr:LysM peptidoglycan-binding domain-containing protein [Verrucomicrobiota bacterium]